MPLANFRDGAYVLPGGPTWSVRWDSGDPITTFQVVIQRASDSSVFWDSGALNVTGQSITSFYYDNGSAASSGLPLLTASTAYKAKITTTVSGGAQIVYGTNSWLPNNVHALPNGQALGGCACGTSTGRTTPAAVLTGDPVNTATGALFERVQDAAMPGAGITFSLERSYNSSDATVGLLGRGWVFPYAAKLVLAADKATYLAEDGQQVVYPKSGSTYSTPAGVTSKLAVAGTGYTLTTHAQEVLTFSSTGALTSWVDRSGKGLTLGYTSGVLSSITDAAGRVVAVATTAGKITKVTLPDARHVDYGYTGDLLTTMTDTAGKVWTYGYDTGNRLNKLTDPTARVIMQTVYGSDGRVTSQKDGTVQQTTYTWNATSGTATVTDPRGGIRDYVYSGNVLLLSHDELGYTTKYVYDDSLNVVATTDRKTNVTSMTYDAAGHMLTRKNAAGYTETWTYTGDDVMTDQDGRSKTTTYTYFTGTHLLKTVTDPAAGITSYTYNTSGQVLTTTSPRGFVTTTTYDAAGNVATVTTPEARQTGYGYDTTGRLTSETDPRGTATGTVGDFTSAWTYDGADRTLTSTDGLGHVTTNTYDAAGNLATAKDPLTHVTTITVDGNNRVKTTKAADNTLTTRAYDGNGNLSSLTDGTGAVTTYGYDAHNQLTTMIRPNGNVSGATSATITANTWTYGYDANGNATTVKDPGAGTTTTGYDVINRPHTITDATGKTTTADYTYTSAANSVATTDRLGNVATATYDDLGRLATQGIFRNTTNKYVYGYDADSNLTSVTSPGLRKTTYGYDKDGLQTSMVDPRGNVTGGTPATYTWTYGFDPAGNATTVKNPLGNTTTTAYDAVNNETSTTDANNHATTWTYDAGDQLHTVTGADTATTTYGYDTVGNLTTLTDPLTHVTTFGYNARGDQIEKVDPLNRTTDWAYSPNGPTSKLTTARANAGVNAAANTVAYTYDGADRLKGRSSTDTGLTSSYTFNTRGLLATMTDATGVTTYTDDNNGQLTQSVKTAGGTPAATFGWGYDADGNVSSRTYDAAGRFQKVSTAKAGTILSQYAATFDPADNPAKITTTRGATSTDESYTYDNANRLTKICSAAATCTGAPNTVGYTYDKVGNRKTMVRAGAVSSPGTTTYTYDNADQLTSTVVGSATPTTYTYDADGNTTGFGPATASFDALNRVRSYTNGTANAAYTYDGQDNRDKVVTASGATTQYLTWDINTALPRVVTRNNPTTVMDIRWDEEQNTPLEQINATALSYYAHDLNNSPTDTTSAAGVALTSRVYDPFGNAATTTLVAGSANPDLYFHGEWREVSQSPTPLDMRARDYTTNLGRFTTTDPLQQATTDPRVNPYSYAHNQPGVLTDPTGQAAREDRGGGVTGNFGGGGRPPPGPRGESGRGAPNPGDPLAHLLEDLAKKIARDGISGPTAYDSSLQPEVPICTDTWNRDSKGRFTGRKGGSYGKQAEEQGLTEYEQRTGDTVIRDQVRVTLPDGTYRYYDGLVRNPDGTYTGIEIKSGSAGLDAKQKEFDKNVNKPDGAATGTLNGQPITVTAAVLSKTKAIQ